MDTNKQIPANFDEYSSGDEETGDYVTKESEKAEKDGYDTGKPGSFLNKLIDHGNKKTEAQLAKEHAANQNTLGQQGTASTTAEQVQGESTLASRSRKEGEVIR